MHHYRILIVIFCLELNKSDQNQTVFYSESRHRGEYVQGDLATSHCLEYWTIPVTFWTLKTTKMSDSEQYILPDAPDDFIDRVVTNEEKALLNTISKQ